MAKVCKKCGAYKDIAEFYNSPMHADGKDTSCKKCRLDKINEKNKTKIAKPIPWFIFD